MFRSILFIAAIAAGVQSAGAEGAPVRWFDAPGPRGVVVLVHGLNNTPEAMTPLARALQTAGFAAGIVTLRGHAGDSAKVVGTAEGWIDDLAAAVDEAGVRYPGKPLFNLSFSLGAAVTINFIAQRGASPFARLVLIAPAIALKGYTAILRPLTVLGWLGVSLPSFIPHDYRSSAWTPLAHYRALFTLVDRVVTRPPREALRRTPGLVLMTAGDEFVSLGRLRRFLRDTGLVDWTIEIVSTPQTGLPHHLLLDERSFGAAEWQAATARIERFLNDAL